MMKVGIDSVSIKRFKKIKNLEAFLKRNFTNYEISYINSKNKNKYQTLAGLFCAKEAVLKALQIGLFNGVSLSKIEVKHNNNGAPEITKNEVVLKALKNAGCQDIQISITHTKKTAVAVCITL